MLFMQVNDKNLKLGRLMYNFEAALEYFISILVAGSFLATITKELGISDALTGILSSIISLGCLFQLLSLFIHKKRMKGFVITMSVINQLLFMFLYVIPLFDFDAKVKTVVFVIAIISAYVIYNMAHPKKITWLMSLVDEHHRGSFTATKEIISLLSGMAFTYLMGALIDHYKALGQIKTAFILSAVVIFVTMVLHTLTMIFTVEKDEGAPPKTNFFRSISIIFKNKNIVRVTFIFCLYYFSLYCSTPFFGTYQINELGFSLTFISIITMAGSLIRAFVSRALGRFADKHSFVSLTLVCLVIWAITGVITALATPQNGKIMFTLYYIINGIASVGFGSMLFNLVFEYAEPEHTSDSLAVALAISGLVGFFATLIVSPLVSYIQGAGNTLFGIPIYAQQVVSIIKVIITIIAIVYTYKTLGGKKQDK